MQGTETGGNMAEKRVEKRVRKRLKLKYGLDNPKKYGFTDDVSEEGVFIRSPQVERPGTLLKVEIEVPGKGIVAFDGKVRWAKRVQVQLVQRGIKGGMGVHIERFSEGEEYFRELY